MKSAARDRIWNAPTADGRRMLMVAMELLMSLYALLYAFPHIPAALMEDVVDTNQDYAEADPPAEEDAGTQWLSVSSTAAMRAALEALLRTSEVLEVSMRAGATTDDIGLADLSNAHSLSRLFDLHLYDADSGVPCTCRQMYESIAAMYRAMAAVDVTTREELRVLYQRYQLLPMGYKMPGLVRMDTGNRSDLIQFCSELTVEWMQPYFSRHPEYYLSRETAAIASTGRG